MALIQASNLTEFYFFGVCVVSLLPANTLRPELSVTLIMAIILLNPRMTRLFVRIVFDGRRLPFYGQTNHVFNQRWRVKDQFSKSSCLLNVLPSMTFGLKRRKEV